MEKVFIRGLMREYLKVNGKIIKWMERESFCGLMEGNT
jgi:hypothetical protein